MATAGETELHICDGAWEALAAPGRADLMTNGQPIRYALGTSAPAIETGGFELPQHSPYRLSPVSIEVPAGTILFIRGEAGTHVTVFVEATP